MAQKIVTLKRGSSFTWKGVRYESGIQQSVDETVAAELESTGHFNVRDAQPAPAKGKAKESDGAGNGATEGSAGQPPKKVKGRK